MDNDKIIEKCGLKDFKGFEYFVIVIKHRDNSTIGYFKISAKLFWKIAKIIGVRYIGDWT